MQNIYTGIGSRQTPKEICNYFSEIAERLAISSYILRSGHAPGADSAFELGCDNAFGKKEIYLPWKGFNGSQSTLYEVSDAAKELAAKYHPSWTYLKYGAKNLQARNSYQVLGLDLATPTNFIICYTEGGKLKGGTAQALRIAADYNIKVFNAGSYANLDDMTYDLEQYLCFPL